MFTNTWEEWWALQDLNELAPTNTQEDRWGLQEVLKELETKLLVTSKEVLKPDLDNDKAILEAL